MTLNYTAAIIKSDVDDVKMLKPGKVWLLSGAGGEQIVCKWDSPGAAGSFGLSKTVMKTVDAAGARSKTMTPADLSELKRWAEFDLAFRTMMLEHRFAGDPNMIKGQDASRELLSTIVKYPVFWTKMPAMELDNIEGALKARLEDGDKGPLAEFAKAPSKSGGLELPGQIIGADAISGNTDRFNPDVTPETRGVPITVAGKDYRYKYIQNAGNIMVLGKGASKTVTGMDFADPNAPYKEMDRTIEQIRSDIGDRWSGDYIIDPMLRKQYAEGVAADLESIVSPHRKTYSPFTKLGRDAAKRIEKGMIIGAKAVRERLANKWRNQRGTPAGVASRISKLNALG